MIGGPFEPTKRGLAAVAALVSTAGFFVASPVLIAGPWLAALAVGHRHGMQRARRAHRRLLGDLPPYVDVLIQRLKAGGSLAQALNSTVATPTVEARLEPLRQALRAGLGLDSGLRRLRAHLSDDEARPAALDLVVNTVAVLVARGGPALPSLERLNDTLRSAEWIEAEARTQAGQATASALMLAALPVLFVAALGVADGRLARFYLFEPVGALCLIVAGSLSYIGWWWMDHLIHRQG